MIVYGSHQQKSYSSSCKWTSINANATIWNPSDVKSPIRRSTPDEDGWRNPLPYSRSTQTGDTRFVRLYGRASGKYLPTYCMPDRHQRADHAGGPLTASNLSSSMYTVPSIPASIQSNLENKALAKLKDRGVNLAVAFGERRETISMLANTVHTLTKSVRALRRGDVRGAANLLGCSELRRPSKYWADNWLAYTYGWKPLISDAYGVTEMLLDNDLARPKRYAVHVSAAATYDQDYRETRSITLSGSLLQSMNVRFLRRTRNKQFIRLDYYLENPQLATAAQLGILNPAEVVWELVPFSFVVDWFIPVGTALAALDATAGWKFRGGSKSTKTTMETLIEKQGNLYWASSTVPLDKGESPFVRVEAATGGSVLFRKMSFSRGIYYASPSASLPRLSENPFSASRLTSAIALLRSAVFGKY